MKHYTDEALIEELMARFQTSRKNMEELKLLNRQLGQVNRKLSESEKLKSHFLSNVRNEIINPLSSILNLSRNLIDADSMPATESKRQAAIIFDEAFTLNFQLKNIFASAEIEAGQLTRDIYKFNYHTLVDALINEYLPLALMKNIKVEYTGTGQKEKEATAFRSDPEKLNLIMANLLVNAINNSDDNSIVRLSSTFDDDRLTLTVQDFGKGIDKKDHEVIFDRFTQLDPVIHTSNKGHGLGLSIVKTFVDFLDGHISLDSEIGIGST
nr:HAMP domain-containing histidine kinase [Bacteroidota bacterium]